MKKRVRPGMMALLFLVLLACQACQSVPITQRKQLTLIPSQQIMAMSYQSYGQFLSRHRVVRNTPEARMVQRVGRRIQAAVGQYFAQQGLSGELKDYRWDFNLIEDDSANAWAMPGGKVAIYTGILPITRDETGLAVVMGHEIAHAVADHGNERMSHQLLAQLGGAALGVALSDHTAQTRNAFLIAYGLGSQVGVLLPYSRVQESEADRLGLIFMAMAGYDPRRAVEFWDRMARQKDGPSPPEFLSTHPSDQTRVADINRHLPEALQYYR